MRSYAIARDLTGLEAKKANGAAWVSTAKKNATQAVLALLLGILAAGPALVCVALASKA